MYIHVSQLPHVQVHIEHECCGGSNPTQGSIFLLPWDLVCVVLHGLYFASVQVFMTMVGESLMLVWVKCVRIIHVSQIYALQDETVHSVIIGRRWKWEGGLICSALCYQHHQTSQWSALYASLWGTGWCRRHPAQTTGMFTCTCIYRCVGDVGTLDWCVGWR